MSESETPKALREFLAEAQEIVEQLGRDLGRLDEQIKRGKQDPGLVNVIFRGAHSLKGISGMFGVQQMASLAHTVENLLDGLRLGKVPQTREVLDVLFESVEVFSLIISDTSKGEQTAGTRVEEAVRHIDRLMMQKPGGKEASPLDALDIDPQVLSVLTEYEEYRLSENVKSGAGLYRVRAVFDLSDFDKGLAELQAKLKGLGEVISILPSSEGNVEAGIAFDILIGCEKSLADVTAEVVDAAKNNISVKAIGKKTDKAAASEPKKPESMMLDDGEAPGDESSLRSVAQTVRVDIKKLDNLMNLVAELLLTQNAILSISEELKREKGFRGTAIKLYKEARHFERRLDELQQGIMEVRMVPLGQVFDKLSRVVRKISREENKEIDFISSGEDTELDKLIIEDLSDPLMHLVRNCIDHGVEPPEERARLGKSIRGIIRMNAFQQGNHVTIEVEDDGRGMDPIRLIETAKKKGLIDQARGEEMSQKEALGLIFLPGFSTKEQVSDLSGRGVGMDVVKTNIANLSGMIDLHSEVGLGSRFTITLPITLAIIQALIVKVERETFAIPLNSVTETLVLRHDQVRTIERREVIELRGATLPLLRLSEAFALPPADAVPLRQFCVIAEIAQHRICLVVDEMFGQQDIVIKPLGKLLGTVEGVAGATDLGAGKTVLVVDVGALVSEAVSGDPTMVHSA
ncbi:MAG: chemotaxis protein CheA [Deltaproteobacteria bacterium]|nr:chemotaxis protein CheA [Deltaproteobacteria bacterium]